MKLPGRPAWLQSVCIVAVLLAVFVVLSSVSSRVASADPPPIVGIASVVGGSADDVLGQYLNADFSQPDFTHGGINDSSNAQALDGPQGVAMDATNHRLFVSDMSNNRVLVFNLTITNTLEDRVADRVLGQADFKGQTANRGGSATSNTLSLPRGLAYDATHDRLFVVDYGNNRVLVYNTTSIVNGQAADNVLGQPNLNSSSTGTTATSLNNPNGVAFDSTANRLFVADNGNSRVLVFNTSSIVDGQAAVVVLGQAGFNSGGQGTTSTTMKNPVDVAYDDGVAKRLFVADTNNNRVLIFDATSLTNGQTAAKVLGQANLTSGSANRGGSVAADTLYSPEGLVYDPAGRLFVSDYSNHRVLVYNAATVNDGDAATGVLGQSGLTSSGSSVAANRLNNPVGLAYDTSGKRLHVADSSNNRVVTFDVDTVANGEDVVDLVGQVDASGNAVYTTKLTDASASAHGLSTPYATLIDSASRRLFVADRNNARVLVFNLGSDGRLPDREPDVVLGEPDFTSTNFATQSGSRLLQPEAMAYDAAGNRLFVIDYGLGLDFAGNRVLVYDTTTITNGQSATRVLGQASSTARAFATTASGINSPSGTAYDPARNLLFVSDEGNNRILAYDIASITDGEAAVNVLGQADFVSGTANRGGAADANTLRNPQALLYDPEGKRLFVSDALNNRVLVYDLTAITDGEPAVNVLGQADFTSVSANRGSSVAAGTLNSPQGMGYDSAGKRLFVADSSNHRVLIFDVTTITDGESAIGVIGQAGLTVGAENRGGSVATNSLRYPFGVTYDPTSMMLYVADASNNRVLVFNAAPSGTAVAINGGASATNSVTVTLSLTATEAIQMEVSESASFTGATYQAYAASRSFTLQDGEGTKTVYARFRDNLLEVSSAVSDSILLDITPPVTFTLGSPATGAITNTASPSLAWAASSDALSGLTKYQLYLDGALDRDNIITSSTSITPSGVLTDGLHTWKVAAADNAGNIRESSSTNSVLVDATPPVTFTLSSPVTGTITNTISPLFAWQASSDALSGLARYQLYVDGLLNRDNVVTSTTSITATSPLTDGQHIWKAVAVDNAGNTRDSSTINSLTVDTIAPTISIVTATVAAGGPVTITWSTNEASSSQVEHGLTSSYGSTTTETDTSTRVISHTVSLGSLASGTHHFRVRSQDAAGNAAVSAESTFTVPSPTLTVYLPLLTKEHPSGW